MSKQWVHHMWHTRSSGYIYGCLTALVGMLQVGTGSQELHDVAVAFPDGDVNGQGTVLIGDVHRSAVLHQDLQGVQKPRPRCVVDRRYAVFVLYVGICSFLQQQACYFGVPHHHYLSKNKHIFISYSAQTSCTEPISLYSI